MRSPSIFSLSLVVWFTLASLAQASAGAALEAEALVRNTTTEILALLRETQGSGSENQARVNELVAEKVLPHFDFERMTRLAAGRNWRNLSDTQRELLVTEFRSLLIRTYSTALTGYQDRSIDYPASAPQSDATKTVVKTRIRQEGATAISIDYRMSLQESGWKVYDISVDGISLVVNYRSMFNSTIESSGADSLIQMIRDKNAAVIDDAPT